MAHDVTDIGAVREQGVNGFNEFIFVREDTLLNPRAIAAAGSPGLNASDVAAGTTAFIMHAAQMNQVASPARRLIEFLRESVHSRTEVRHRARAMRSCTNRL